jgi:3-deoxy-D-manno-octulosonic-acid transferase
VRRFLDHWRPDLVLWTESDLWPNTLMEIGRRRVPLVLLNARLSDKAARGWQRWPGFARDVMTPFTLVLAQSDVDAQRFRVLGAANVRAQGNLKLAAPPLPFDAALLASLRAEIKGRPVWLAASIHPGEDAIAAEVARTLAPRFPGLLTLIVPRHTEKGRAMAQVMTGLRSALRSETKVIAADVDVYVADTMGEIGLFFRLSEIVFMGKSLAVGGGQNPAEPALIGCALVLGSDMSNFREMTAELLRAGAAVQVSDTARLTEAVGALLEDADRRTGMIGAGQGVMRHHANAVKDTLAALAPYLAASKIQ